MRTLWRRVRGGAARVGGRAARVLSDDTGGLDDAAMPSGYAAPYRRGSRQVRNLWHIPF